MGDSIREDRFLQWVFYSWVIDRPGEMRKAKPPQGIAAVHAAFEEAQAVEATP